MPNANNLSPFRRKNKQFIIPSSYYKNLKKAKIIGVEDHTNLIEDKNIKNALEKNNGGSKLILKETNLLKEKNDFSNLDSKGVSRYSLSSIKIEKEAKKRLNDKKASIESFHDKFDLEMLTSQWKKYIQTKHSNGENIIASLFEMTNIKLKEDAVMIIETDSEANKHQITNETPSILSFLKESLNNYKITLKVNIVSKDKSKSIFTIKEKFDYLESINPDIKLLMDEFKIKL